MSITPNLLRRRVVLVVLFVSTIFSSSFFIWGSKTDAQSLSNTELFLENSRAAEELLQAGNYHHARLLLEHNLSMFPSSPSRVIAIADMDLKWGRHIEVHRNLTVARPYYERAYEMYEQALAMFSEDEKQQLQDSILQDLYISMAKAKLMARDYEKAISILEDFLVRQPQHARANYWLGVTLRQRLDEQGDPGDIERDSQIYEIDSYFTRALRYNSKREHLPLAYIFVGLLDFQAGVRHLAEARLLEGTRQMEVLATMESIGDPVFTDFEQKYYNEARTILRRLGH